MNPDPALQEQLRNMLSKSRRSLKAAEYHLSEAEFGAKASRLFRERQIGDYEFDVSVTGPDAKQDVAVAADMVDAIEIALP